MLYMYNWITKSTNEAWCLEGYDLFNTDDFNRSAQRLITKLTQQSGVNPPSDLRITILNNIPKTPPNNS